MAIPKNLGDISLSSFIVASNDLGNVMWYGKKDSETHPTQTTCHFWGTDFLGMDIFAQDFFHGDFKKQQYPGWDLK